MASTPTTGRASTMTSTGGSPSSSAIPTAPSSGGLLGGTYWGWLYVEILWVAEHVRGAEHGRALLAAAEQEAVRRGCRHAHLDTMSFQSRSFYERQGYTVFGELRDIPAGHQRYFMQKALA